MIISVVLPFAQISVMTLVFALGLRTDPADLTYLLHRPSQLLRSLLSINLAMPLVAALIVSLLSIEPPVRTVIIALGLAPLPPLLPAKPAKAGGNAAYTLSLLVSAAMFAIVSIPLSIEIIERVIGLPLQVPPAAIAKVVLMTIIIPLGLGLTVRHFAASIAETISGPLSRLAGLILLLTLVILVIASGSAMLAQIGNGTLLALALFIVAGLLIGHLLGGPEPSDRTVLAMATASRHPGVAIALISATFPDTVAVLPVVLLYMITSAIIDAPYIAWRKKSGAVLLSV
jgi:BASS family bile acid:Na+ symporter